LGAIKYLGYEKIIAFNFVFSYGAVEAQTATTNTPATNITQTSADLSGSVDAAGTATYKCRFWYRVDGSGASWTKIAANPGTVSGSGSQNESVSLSGLTQNTTYEYYMVLVTNDLAETYVADGGKQTFTTLSDPTATTGSSNNITKTTVDLDGAVTLAGSTDSHDLYFRYRVQGSGTSYASVPATPSSTTVDNNNVTTTLTGLTAGTTYEWFMYMENTNISPAGVYSGNIATFTTAAPPSVVTNTTSTYTNISATLSGSITAPSGETYDVMFRYRVDGSGDFGWKVASAGTVVCNGAAQSFTANISNLNPATLYNVEAYAIDKSVSPYAYYYAGDATGDFTTLGDPTVTTVTPATAITATEATISGTANTNNTGSYNAFIGYRVNGAGTYQWQNVGTLSSSTSAQSFNRILSGLVANTTYQYQAAISLDGTVGNEDFFGAIETFTTNAAGLPTVTTGDFGQIAGTTGEITDNVITDDGGGAIKSYGLAYGSSANPTTEKQAGTSAGATPFNFNVAGTNLTPSTKYYIRAYARNGAGTSYGSDKTFYTEPTSVTHFDAISGLDYTEPQNNKSVTLNFGGTTPGNGTGVIIKISSAGGITQPVDGTTYSANTSSPHNNETVYVGSNVGSVTITGLDGDKDYEFQMWEYAGSGTGDASNYGINYKTDVLPQKITTNNTEFPIELLSFTAKNDNGNVLIKWITASETNNDYFEIERSNDAENFEVIANVSGAGYSNTKIDYSIVDNDVLDGTVYYRLKQTDFNGEFTYSYILPVQIGGSNELQISNIISTDNSISFIYNNSKGGNTQVELLDMTGRIIKTKQVSGEGSQLVRMNMRGMSHGIYILHLTIDNEMITKKVVY